MTRLLYIMQRLLSTLLFKELLRWTRSERV